MPRLTDVILFGFDICLGVLVNLMCDESCHFAFFSIYIECMGVLVNLMVN
jgi:hypothetical protein